MTETVVSAGGLTVLMVAHGVGIHLLLYVDRRLRARGALVIALGCLVEAAVSAFLHLHLLSVFYAAAAAYWLWIWRNNGGGDGMKRRLKSWARSLGFGPYAAPSAA